MEEKLGNWYMSRELGGIWFIGNSLGTPGAVSEGF